MPSRSMSPSTVEETLFSSTPRAEAMLAMPEVRQAAMACSRYSTGVGRVVRADEHGRVVGLDLGLVRVLASPASRRRSRSSVDRLWVPLTHVLVARNWNLAISFCP